jgi:uncharacterized membrane protein YfhO
VYYPKGWKADIDGKEVDILRLNYLFRGVVIPEGNHILKMKFEPESFLWGRRISLILNLLVLGGVLTIGGFHFRKRISYRRRVSSDGDNF